MKGKALQYQCDFKRWAGWVQTGMGRDLVYTSSWGGDAALSWYQCATPSPQCPQNALMSTVPFQAHSVPITPFLLLGPADLFLLDLLWPDQEFQQWLVSPEIRWCIILAPLEPLCIHSANWKGGILVNIFFGMHPCFPLSATRGGLLSQPGCTVFLSKKFTSWLFQNMPNYLLKFLE